jgi:prevent-host-death family protein
MKKNTQKMGKLRTQQESLWRLPMIAEVNAAEFRDRAGDLLSRVQSLQGSVLIRESGEPIAVLVDVESYRRLMWQRLDELTAPIREAFADIPEEVGHAMIDEAVRAVRHP